MDSKIETPQQQSQPPAVASKDLLGAMYRGSDGAMICAVCHCEMEWGECGGLGCEDGYYDAYEDDPNFYDPGDWVACPQCNGRGGSWYCETKDCPTGEGWKEIPAPKAPNDKLSESGGEQRKT